jgi:hypothetical protein
MNNNERESSFKIQIICLASIFPNILLFFLLKHENNAWTDFSEG